MTVPTPGRVDPLVPVVRREWRHIDLFVDTGMTGHRLVLENKLHSLPSNEQLERYASDSGLTSTDSIGIRWVLLSLLEPIGELPRPWRFVPYGEYSRAMSECATNIQDPFAKALITHYAAMTEQLVQLASAVDPANHPAAALLLSSDLRSTFQKARLLPLVEKLRATRLAQATARQFGNDADTSFGAGFSNTRSLVEYYTKGPKGRLFGWQLQGDQMRLVVMTSKSDARTRASREELVQREHDDFFNFSPSGLEAATLGENKSRKQWLGYEPNFVYRYRPLNPGVTFDECVRMCVAFTAWTHAYLDHLQNSDGVAPR